MEEEFYDLIAEWRGLENAVLIATDLANKKRQEVLDAMQQAGMRKAETPLGKISLVGSKKCNVLVDRDEFEAKLKREGMYDRFVSAKFDLAAVKKYAEEQDDDLFGMVEVETTYSPRFTPTK